MSQRGQEDGEAGASSIDLPATPSSNYQPPDDDEISRPSSSSTQLSPIETHPPVKCQWCQEEFLFTTSDQILPKKALEEHLNSAHPDVTSHAKNNVIHKTSVTDGVRSAPAESNPPKRGQRDLGVEQRIQLGWKINDVKSFTNDYLGEKDDLDTVWKRLFDGFERPKPYEFDHTDPGDFLPITDPEIYIDLLKAPESHSTDELYTITANAAKALEVWQDEYIAINELTRLATRRAMKKAVDPRKPEDPDIFEDKKEARLYGYKYDARPSKVGCQNPFLQGGFKPTAEQMKKMKAAAADPYNVDGWTPVMKDGVAYVPRIRPPPPPEPKRKAGAVAAGEVEHRRHGKRITRYGGSRNPTTREGSRALTERSSPTPSVRTRTQSPEAPDSPRSSYNDRSRRKTRSGAYQRPADLATKSTRSRATKPSALGPNRTRTAPTSAPPTGLTTTATTPASTPTPGSNTPVYDDPCQDPKNQEKIRQSKHPKRTEAMIRHWAKFNSEGRTRNPKRTKAQIEADRAAQAATAPAKKRKLEADNGQASTTASSPVPKRQRRPATKLGTFSEMGSPTSEPSMQVGGDIVPHFQRIRPAARVAKSPAPQLAENGL
ncbi:hypothetical protein LOZ65_003779 [Ophidiomyces ophidiicola]|nr:hypothetical protein LOZ65_003779 [Ophidiomyces ophidiicola]